MACILMKYPFATRGEFASTGESDCTKLNIVSSITLTSSCIEGVIASESQFMSLKIMKTPSPFDLTDPSLDARSHSKQALTASARGLYPAEAWPRSFKNSFNGSNEAGAKYATLP